jgi:hypothetical protein
MPPRAHPAYDRLSGFQPSSLTASMFAAFRKCLAIDSPASTSPTALAARQLDHQPNRFFRAKLLRLPNDIGLRLGGDHFFRQGWRVWLQQIGESAQLKHDGLIFGDCRRVAASRCLHAIGSDPYAGRNEISSQQNRPEARTARFPLFPLRSSLSNSRHGAPHAWLRSWRFSRAAASKQESGDKPCHQCDGSGDQKRLAECHPGQDNGHYGLHQSV